MSLYSTTLYIVRLFKGSYERNYMLESSRNDGYSDFDICISSWPQISLLSSEKIWETKYIIPVYVHVFILQGRHGVGLHWSLYSSFCPKSQKVTKKFTVRWLPKSNRVNWEVLYVIASSLSCNQTASAKSELEIDVKCHALSTFINFHSTTLQDHAGLVK